MVLIVNSDKSDIALIKTNHVNNNEKIVKSIMLLSITQTL
jgi:hypothetical protein